MTWESACEQADDENDATRRAELREQEIDAYRSAVQANPQNEMALSNLERVR